MNKPKQTELERVYGESQKSGARFQKLGEQFHKIYGWEKADFFSAPGRTEMIGNHTDHNGGLVLAASVSMDTIGAACPNNSDEIHITSEGYSSEIVVDLNAIDQVEKVQGTQSLVAGMVEGIRNAGFVVSGFDAYVSTEVISAAGVSSSASFEMLVCSMINYFFNDNAMTCTDYAKAGQYAENVFWNKASGLMDQMACAVGGAILLDFSGEQPTYEHMDFSFQSLGYHLVIVNTGKGHADLGDVYSEIPLEMRQAASAASAERLCDTDWESVLKNISHIENDRAILRALHFFEENKRVRRAAEAITAGDKRELLSQLEKSGTSSWELLQNCYALQNYTEQKIPLALALTRLFLEQAGDGVCRIHGGGFAGVIMAVVPEDKTESYVAYISAFVGRENVYPLDIRAAGAVRLERE